jgi:hypothetical protein
MHQTQSYLQDAGIDNVFFLINLVEKCTRSFPRCYTCTSREEKWRHVVFWSLRSHRRLLESRPPLKCNWARYASLWNYASQWRICDELPRLAAPAWAISSEWMDPVMHGAMDMTYTTNTASWFPTYARVGFEFQISQINVAYQFETVHVHSFIHSFSSKIWSVLKLSRQRSLKGYLVNCLEHFFLLFFCFQIMFPQLFALFQILFLLLSCRNAVFLTSMSARG